MALHPLTIVQVSGFFVTKPLIMLVKNDNNAFPEIIDSIIKLLHPEDKKNIISLENVDLL